MCSQASKGTAGRLAQGVEIGQQRRRRLPCLQRVEPLQAARTVSRSFRTDRSCTFGIGISMNRRRAVFTRGAQTLPLSLPLPGRPKRSRNR